MDGYITNKILHNISQANYKQTVFYMINNLQFEPYIVKTQLNHSQVEVGLTRLWVLTHPPPTQVKLCVVVVQVSSKQRKQQHNTGLNYVF